MRNRQPTVDHSRFAAWIQNLVTTARDHRSLFDDGLSFAMILVGAVGLPLSVARIGEGSAAAMFVAITVASAGAAALAFRQFGREQSAAQIQSAGIAGSGLVLLWADPAVLLPVFALMGLAAVRSVRAYAPSKKINLGFLFAVAPALSGLVLGNLLQIISDASSTSTVLILTFMVLGLGVFESCMQFLSWPGAGAVARKTEDGVHARLMESVSDGIVRLDREGKLLFASPGSEHMFGCKTYALLGDGLLQRVHVLDRPAFLKSVSDAAHYGETRRVDVRVRRDDLHGKSGETRFVWAEMCFCCDTDETADGPMHGLVRDISVRKDQEQRLEDARREAEENSTSKSRFLATMGHELRTPLNAIVGFSEMMTAGIGGQLDPAHEEYATMIGESGRHLLDVVNMLLDMSKINAGKFELHLAEFEPEGLIEPSLYMVSATAKAKQVRVETDIPANLPIIKADERACRQIMINLLSNAIKFSKPEGVVRLVVRRQGAKLNVTVSDDGIGMSREQIERLGEPFFQAHAGLARQYEGTGLGLSIVKGLVDLHDGTFRVISSPNEGTSIMILLPLLGPEPDAGHETVARLDLKSPAHNSSPVEQPEKQSVAS